MATSASRMADRQIPALPRLATGLAFAAAPAFALMVVVSGLPAEAMPVTCLGGPETSLFGGMPWMYAMMSVVHLPPWLKLIAARHAAPPA